MRFPKINDVAAELREINKTELQPEDADEGIDVRLQVYSDGDWAVRSGSSDYDQDHKGFWGASSVPGNNRRFSSKDVARELIDQAKNAHAEGAGLEEAPRTKESSGLKIEIPNMPQWEQIGGDMNPAAHGGLIARSDGSALELLEIQPVRAYVGDGEAAEVGFPFWTKEGWYDLADLNPERKEVQDALESIGMTLDELSEEAGGRKAAGERGYTPAQRALVIAEALMGYGTGSEEGPAGWSSDIYADEEVKWWDGKVQTIESVLAEEDDEFRREVLREEEEEDEDLEEAPRGSKRQRREQSYGSFIVKLWGGQTGRFHDMPRAQEWALSRLEGQPPGSYAAFYRAPVARGRHDTGQPWTEPFHVLIVNEYGRIRVAGKDDWPRDLTPRREPFPHRGSEQRSAREAGRTKVRRDARTAETTVNEYQGWANWETWNVALWFGNDEGLYHAVRDHRGKFTATSAKEFTLDLLPDGTPDFEGEPERYRRVKWSEIAKDFNELRA